MPEDMKKIHQRLVRWIEEKVLQAKAQGVVLGLSGGVDSSLVAALAVEALGKENVLGLFLPCNSDRDDLVDAEILARELKIRTGFLNLSPIYTVLLKILPKGDLLSQANLKPRLRMMILYYYANMLNYLVAGTGNKSEISVGYFTKYGDGAADILPLGDFYKSEVKKLAVFVGVPKHIINKVPSAGLWKGQTDENEMGITYPELEKILIALEQGKKTQGKKVAKVRKMLQKAQHKLKMPEVFRKQSRI
jgi:NAD+ synthase